MVIQPLLEDFWEPGAHFLGCSLPDSGQLSLLQKAPSVGSNLPPIAISFSLGNTSLALQLSLLTRHSIPAHTSNQSDWLTIVHLKPEKPDPMRCHLGLWWEGNHWQRGTLLMSDTGIRTSNECPAYCVFYWSRFEKHCVDVFVWNLNLNPTHMDSKTNSECGF